MNHQLVIFREAQFLNMRGNFTALTAQSEAPVFHNSLIAWPAFFQ
jgi:hypothetical protein